MKAFRIAVACVLLIAPAAWAQGPQTIQPPEVSVRQDVAVFALGYYGWSIPAQALGSIDSEVQKVFADMARFNVFGVAQRLSSGGLNDFMEALRAVKQQNMAIPDKYVFGEAFLTQAEFNRLAGAFVVAVPVVTWFQSRYDSKNAQWETEITTAVTLLNAAEGGKVIAIKNLKTSGRDKDSQMKATRSAISDIPAQLEYELRTIPQFQIRTSILSVTGSEIRFRLGQDLGIRKGDEYAIIATDNFMGIAEEREAGLVVVKEVRQGTSIGQILYSDVKPGVNIGMREIPRKGVDLDIFAHFTTGSGGSAPVFSPGLRIAPSRGFFGLRPFVLLQLPLGQIYLGSGSATPVNLTAGGELNLFFGRLAVTPWIGVGGTFTHSDTKDEISHAGGAGAVRVSYLLGRNMRVFGEAGYDFWASLDGASYRRVQGVTFGGGILFKL